MKIRGLDLKEARRLRELEKENTELKKLLVDQLLKAKALEIALRKTSEPGPTEGGCHPGALQGLPGEQETGSTDPVREEPRVSVTRGFQRACSSRPPTYTYTHVWFGDFVADFTQRGGRREWGSRVTTGPNSSPAPSKTGWLKTRSSPSTSIPVAHGRTGMPRASTVVSASSVSIENYPTA
jgi:hypothetical protein